jgi:hypothetical protein
MPDDVPVLSSQLQELKDFMIDEMGKLTKEIRDVNVMIERVDKQVSILTRRVEKFESGPDKTEETEATETDEDVAYGSDGLPDHKQTSEKKLHRILEKK